MTTPHEDAIDDTAQGMPMSGPTALAAFLDLNGKDEPPMATCPNDGEPLIMTMERNGAEFHCLKCGRWLGFLAPRPADATDELVARHDELQGRFNTGDRGPIEDL